MIDGDTAVFTVGGVLERVRFLSINTPEVRGDAPFNKEATAFTRAALAEPVKLVYEDARATRDRYGRLLAWLEFRDGQLLNLMLVEEGLAVPYLIRPFERDALLYNAAAEGAQSVAKGVWAARRELPVFRPELPRL